jgi:hypothetical protein
MEVAMVSRRTSPAASRAKAKPSPKASGRKWSGEVTKHSNALDLEKDVFKSGSAEEIAKSLKRSAERSRRRKSSPYRSAMSMLTFYENRAGKNLSARRRHILELAKDKLRALFGRKAERRKAERTRKEA